MIEFKSSSISPLLIPITVLLYPLSSSKRLMAINYG